MNDILGTLRSWLAAQSAITDLVNDRLFVNRLPEDVVEREDTFHPSKMIVISASGGQGRTDFQALDAPSINVLCYGETDLEADKVRREVWDAFRKLSRVRHEGVLIHHVNPTGGATFSRDPDIVWPIVRQPFSILAATEA